MAVIKKAPNDTDPLSNPNHNTVHGAIKTYTEDGWSDASEETWVYASASTFTIASVDLTGKYYLGIRLRYKQGGAYKYAQVASSSFSTNTTVTIVVDTTVIANSAITDNWSSISVNPLNSTSALGTYTAWTTWVPTITSGSGTATTITVTQARYNQIGKQVTFKIVLTITDKGTAGGNLNFSLPINATDTSWAGWAGESIVTGLSGVVRGATVSTGLLHKYDGTTPYTNNQVWAFGGIYEVA